MMALVAALALAAQLAAGAAAKPAPVEIVVYSDFQCPYCRQFAGPTHALVADGLGGIPVRVTFKNFPLPFHLNARLAHRAAMAAKAQGRFWEMHDLLFANASRLQRSDLIGYAKRLGLDVAQFEKDMDSDAVREAIDADIAEGMRAGVNATPSYFINGELFAGARTVAQIRELIVGGRVVGDRRAAAVAPSVADESLAKGRATAPVTIELFADLLSPLSRAAVDAVDRIQARHPAAVRVQFRNFPLTFHPLAEIAHEAAMAAASSGRFWEMAAFVLDHQNAIGEAELVAGARGLGLDDSTFADALRQHRFRERVDADRDLAASRGVRGSPAILVNGIRIDGVPTLRTLADYVATALAEAQPDGAKRP